MYRLIFLTTLFLFSNSSKAADAFAKFNIVLMQPEAVLQVRVSSVQNLAGYIRALEAKANSTVKNISAGQAASGFIVVAVRPGLQSNIWLDFEPALPVELHSNLIKELRSVKPIQVKDGPVVFAIEVGLWGGTKSDRISPSPVEWKAAVSKADRPLEVSELVEMIWSK